MIFCLKLSIKSENNQPFLYGFLSITPIKFLNSCHLQVYDCVRFGSDPSSGIILQQLSYEYFGLLPLKIINPKVFIYKGIEEYKFSTYCIVNQQNQNSRILLQIFRNILWLLHIFYFVICFHPKLNFKSNNARQRLTHKTANTALINVFKKEQNVCAYSINTTRDFFLVVTIQQKIQTSWRLLGELIFCSI